MIGNLLILLSIVILLSSFLNLFRSYWKSKKCEDRELNGFELAKEITSNYDEINIVESKNIWVSQYDMRRNIIRLIPRDYESKSVFTLAMVSQLAGYSLLKIQGNFYLKVLMRFFSKLSCFLISFGIVVLVSLFTNTMGDAKIGLIILTIILIYQYFRIQVQELSYDLLKSGNFAQEMQWIWEINDCFLWLHKTSFIVTLILMIREVIIILGI